MKKIITTDKAPTAIGPYAQANLVNGTLYISGQIPINPENGLLIEGIQEATHQVMKNLQAILEEAGMSFKDVVKSTVLLKNIEDFSSMNESYASYLEEGYYPAREAFQVACLPKNADVEISMIAHKD